MNFKYKLIFAAVMAASLSACSNTALNEANNGFDYLNTPALDTWHVPAGAATFSSNEYTIPQGNITGNIGSKVNILPPQQVLPLIQGMQSITDNQGATLKLPQADQVAQLWAAAEQIFTAKKVAFTRQADNSLQTDWMDWGTKDKTGIRYRLSQSITPEGAYLTASVLGLTNDGKVIPLSTANQDRYSIILLNHVMAQYQANEQKLAAAQAAKLMTNIQIYVGQDRSGLPVIIAQAPYDAVWVRLPGLLNQLGMKVTALNQSQGSITVKYDAPKSAFWTSLGVSPMTLKNQAYQLLVGDLGNRASINITTKAGQLVAKSVLESVSPALSAILTRDNTTK